MMAKTSDNIRPCNIGQSEAHNRRTPQYLAHINKDNIYLRTDLMDGNEAWVSPRIEGVSLREYYKSLGEMVKTKTGRAMQTKDRTRLNKKTGKTTTVRGSTPIKEGVVVCKADTTMEQLQRYGQLCYEHWGITPLQIFIHRDEGHYEIPGDKTTWKPNYHAHIVWDWMNHDTGKSCKLTPQDMSEMQTILAEALDMERGTAKELTGREHLERTDYIIAKQKREAEKARAAKERTEAELKAVKSELKTEKLKNSAAEVGTTILDGIGSMIGTSKVKRQQQQIDDLAKENERLHSEIKRQNKTIDRERRKHEQTAKRMQGEIDRIYGWFPDTPQLVKWGEYCRSLGFTDKMARDLVNMRPVHFSGKLYSSEHSRHFETEHSEARLLRDEKGPGGFQLFIDLIPILQWFRQKAKEFLERLGIEIKDREQDRGMRMR
ncbi:hypothetical protein [uncultured Alistipes sp.]|uniref:hypothetical protein n=1 Tax=uncultured Alistipes sp. TaxID=538949 RepID=UPI0025F25064|nr:hypothetical protein [uncultured Alistipes sp.]